MQTFSLSLSWRFSRLAPSFSYATNNFAQILFSNSFLFIPPSIPLSLSLSFSNALSPVHILPLLLAMQYSAMVSITFCYIYIPVVVYIGRKESDMKSERSGHEPSVAEGHRSEESFIPPKISIGLPYSLVHPLFSSK